ncbi:myosin-14-like [Macrobrachium nipponense]|uniref:myosin-14-like n=1 Tax=Macrobrachium nipponense TaxID=159736 RepID=UPI0030C7D30F
MTSDELHEGLSEWGKAAKETLLQKCKSQTQLSTLCKESEELSCELRAEYNHFASLLRMQREFLQNIVGLVPFIKEKRHLEVEIATERGQLQEDEKVHQEKVADRQRKSEVALEELKKKFGFQKSGAVEKAKKAEISYEKEVVQLDEEIKKLTDKLKQMEICHLDTLSDLESKHKIEQEYLQYRIQLLKENRSSQALTDKAVITRKVRTVELEYKAKLEEMGKNLEDHKAQNTQLKEELRTVHEALRHQELLNIVRNVPPWSRSTTGLPAPEQISADSPIQTRARTRYSDSSGETTQVSSTKDVDLGGQEKTFSPQYSSSKSVRRKLFKRKATEPLSNI